MLKTVDRTDSLSVKWDEKTIEKLCGNPKAHPFWVADLDFPSPKAVSSAVAQIAQHGVFGYPKFQDLPQVFAHWAQQRHQWSVDPDLVLFAPGMLFSISTLIELYSKPNDSIILPLPAYRPFSQIILGLGRKIVQWPMLYDSQKGHFSLDMEALEPLLRQTGAPILLFCSPHNPTGRLFSSEELHAVARILSRYETVVISDEIHAEEKQLDGSSRAHVRHQATLVALELLLP